jgi:hypothetical protein
MRQTLTPMRARPVLATLSEDANLGPAPVAARVPSVIGDLILCDAVEEEDHLCMAEAIEACKGLRREAGRVKLDRRTALSPIVLGNVAPASYMADSAYRDGCHALAPAHVRCQQTSLALLWRFRAERAFVTKP